MKFKDFCEGTCYTPEDANAKSCVARSPSVGDTPIPYHCTLPPDHDGLHVACGGSTPETFAEDINHAYCVWGDDGKVLLYHLFGRVKVNNLKEEFNAEVQA